jgi:hypothetical protein
MSMSSPRKRIQRFDRRCNKALQRLREMPPFAREREIEIGRYREFSSQEKQILRNAALPSRADNRDLRDSFPQSVSQNSH